MEFLRIEPTDTLRWNAMWKLYEKSFLYRNVERKKIIFEPVPIHFSSFVDMEDDQLIGIIFYWEWGSYRYTEYLAVNPQLRNQG